MAGYIVQCVVLLLLICFGLWLMEVATICHGINKGKISLKVFQQLIESSRSPFAPIHFSFEEFAKMDASWGSLANRVIPIVVWLIPYEGFVVAIIRSNSLEVTLIHLLGLLFSTYMIYTSFRFNLSIYSHLKQ